MIRIPLTEAQLRLSELIASLQLGEEVQIFPDKAIAYLIKTLMEWMDIKMIEETGNL